MVPEVQTLPTPYHQKLTSGGLKRRFLQNKIHHKSTTNPPPNDGPPPRVCLPNISTVALIVSEKSKKNAWATQTTLLTLAPLSLDRVFSSSDSTSHLRLPLGEKNLSRSLRITRVIERQTERQTRNGYVKMDS